MADDPDDILFDAPPPADAGELVKEDASEVLGYVEMERPPTVSLPGQSSVIDPPWGPPEHATPQEQIAWYRALYRDVPMMTISVKQKWYLLYEKIQFRAEVKNVLTGKPMRAKSIKFIMDTGNGQFTKQKNNTSELKKTEEKYGKFDQSKIYLHVVAKVGPYTLKGVIN